MTFDEWREANYDTDWNDREYARRAWVFAEQQARQRCVDELEARGFAAADAP